MIPTQQDVTKIIDTWCKNKTTSPYRNCTINAFEFIAIENIDCIDHEIARIDCNIRFAPITATVFLHYELIFAVA